MNRRNLIPTALMVELAVCCAPLYAQTAAPASAEAATLTEIVVTATRREERLQDVPLPVTVLSGAETLERGITNSRDLVAIVPNMAINFANGPNSPQYNLRGIGANDNFATSAAAVGAYFDDIYANNIFGQSTPLYDLRRVEVLRGPQGTLWGKNTTAGAINFITNPPEAAFGGYVQAGVGNYGLQRIEGAIGGSLIDGKLMTRTSIYHTKRSGLYFNTIRNVKSAGKYRESSIRQQLLWKPTGNFSAKLLLSARDEADTGYYGVVGALPGGVNLNGFRSDLEHGVFSNDVDGAARLKDSRATLHLDWNLASGLSVSSISGYYKMRFEPFFDIDGGPTAANAGTQTIATEQYSEELRLTTDSSAKLRGMVGLFYLREKFDWVNASIVPAVAPATVTTGTFRIADQWTNSRALFGHLEYDFNATTQLRLGGRYTRESKHMILNASSYRSTAQNPFDLALATNIVRFDGGDVIHTDPKFTWDATLQHTFAPGKMIYGRVATGFKASVFNVAVFAAGGFSRANPENLTDYELGTKTTWADGRVMFNANVFRYDYDGYQIQLLSGVNLLARVYSNADKAKATGVEAEFGYRATDRLTLKISGGYTSAKFVRFPNASVTASVNSNLPLDVSGEPLPLSPRGTGSLFAEYRIPNVSNGELAFSTDWNYVGETIYTIWPGLPDSALRPQAAFVTLIPALRAAWTEDSYVLGNARVSYRFGANRAAEVAVWTRNLTDKFYRTSRNQNDPLRSVAFTRGDPRTIGVTYKRDF
jgi:iron complex outermembrane recepter protein